MIFTSLKIKNISSEQWFMLSALVVNGGNYLYNLILGRVLGPTQFADAAVLITFLLVLSFAAMTFQLVTAKFSVLFEDQVFKSFINQVYKSSILVGLITGILIVIFARQLQVVFNTSSSNMFVVFGLGVPLYFIMSVNRGVYQGWKEFKSLSITYQSEMLSRLIITLGLILLFNIQSSFVIAIGIFSSFIFGLIPFKMPEIFSNKTLKLSNAHSKAIRNFFAITAFYECTQIVINNSDILFVKHYFESYEAGLYASLALIGRIVYFIAWMFVMLLLPSVVQLQKQGKNTAPILFKYVGYITFIAGIIILGCVLFPKTAILLLFGNEYLAMAPLLWKYALATGLFAVSNIFAYYYLSLNKNIPVFISAIFGLLQMGLIIFFHDTLEQVVLMQVVTMFLLLLFQLAYYFFDLKRNY